MKQTKIALACFAVLAIAAAFYYSDKLLALLPKDDTIAVSVIGDFTDKHIKNPDQSEIVRVFHLDDRHLCSGYSMRYRQVSDRVQGGDIKTLSVPAVSPLLADERERVAMLKEFRDRIRQVFDSSNVNKGAPLSKSSIYRLVVFECNILMQTKATERYLVIYSDMLDNDKFLNIYNPIIKDQMQNRPLEVAASLRKVAELDNLKGLRCLIVFQSSSEKDEENFMVASNFYRKLLTNAGAECKVITAIDPNQFTYEQDEK